MGDLVNGCFGDVVSGFFAGFAAEIPDDGASFEGFEDEAAFSFEATDVRLVGFLVSLAGSVFGSLEGADLGDSLLGVDCLPDAVALVGVRGSGEVVFCLLLLDLSVTLEAAGGVAG